MPTVADPARPAPSGAAGASAARRSGGGRHTAARVLRAAGSAVLVLWGAVTVTFIALNLVKGDPVIAITGQAQISPEVRAQIIADYHLDRSPIEQYFAYLWNLLRGDLGTSYALREPVSSAIGTQIVPTLQLIAAATVLSLVLAVLVGVLTANRGRFRRGAASSVEVLLVATPAFWFGILLLTIFSFGLKWLPSIGSTGFSSLILPTIALAAAPAALLAQVLRQSLEKVLEEPFIVTARTRGLSDSAVLLRHALRHAILPVITLSGWITGALISGAVVIEQVFARQGLGRLMVNAIGSRDFPLITGITLVAALFYVIANVAIDALYTRLDPRLRKASA